MVNIEITYHAIATPAKIQAIFLLLLCFGLLKINSIITVTFKTTQPEPSGLMHAYFTTGCSVKLW